MEAFAFIRYYLQKDFRVHGELEIQMLQSITKRILLFGLSMQGKGISIHLKNYRNILNTEIDTARFIEIEWIENIQENPTVMDYPHLPCQKTDLSWHLVKMKGCHNYPWITTK